MSSIFLSHSHTDKPFARRLAADLRAAGHSVWIDEAEVNIGDSLIEKIRASLDSVDFVAAILSEASVNSEWVKKELDIASNRELVESRVVVLPIKIQQVELPGFLQGKFYGDFTSNDLYKELFERLLRGLGEAAPIPSLNEGELKNLRKELFQAKAEIARHAAGLQVHGRIALRGKSKRLVKAIEEDNKRHPEHAPINLTHAFEVGDLAVTLGYLQWAITKSERDGGHPLVTLLTLEDQWKDAEAMLLAWGEMLQAYGRAVVALDPPKP